ncbi:unnamed protein product [Penicillium glandicola]
MLTHDLDTSMFGDIRPLQQLVLTGFLLILVYVLINEIVCYSQQIPGLAIPPVFPLVGNLHQLRTNAAEQYREWAQELGSVYQVRLGNIPVMVINSAAAAKVILGHNSQATASRPQLYTYHKLVSSTAGTTIGAAPYNESLIRRRKGAASALNHPSVETYVPHLDIETKDFVKGLLRYGDFGRKVVDPVAMLQRLSLSLACTINWGTRITSHNDQLLSEITHVETEISRIRSTTDNLRDYIPLLRFIPYSPGKRRAAGYRQRRDRYLAKLNRDLEERINNGTHKPCIQANVILEKEAKLNDVELTSISLSMLSGGLETTTAVMTWAIVILAMRPEIQRKAITEIQNMYGVHDLLCNANDDQKCKYIAAIARESLRYRHRISSVFAR